MTSSSSDVLIVGAGIVGLAHAAEAVERGLTVTIIERDRRAVGASIRNFGHIGVSALAGDLRAVAGESRERWLKYAALAGFWLAESGSAVVARSQAELAVLDEAAGASDGRIEAMTASSVREQLNLSAGRSDILGGALLTEDLRVDPRTTVVRLANWLMEQPSVRFFWGTAATGFSPGVVHSSKGYHLADRVYVCVGHDLDYLFPNLAMERQMQRRSSQMIAVAAPRGFRCEVAVLTATSALRYDAFGRTESAAALREELDRERPELLRAGVATMFTQRPDGSLLVGESRSYDSAAAPFQEEETARLLLDDMNRLLGADLRVKQRWQGVDAFSPLAPVLVAEPAPGVTAVSVTSGLGMTLSFGLAQRNIGKIAGSFSPQSVA